MGGPKDSLYQWHGDVQGRDLAHGPLAVGRRPQEQASRYHRKRRFGVSDCSRASEGADDARR